MFIFGDIFKIGLKLQRNMFYFLKLFNKFELNYIKKKYRKDLLFTSNHLIDKRHKKANNESLHIFLREKLIFKVFDVKKDTQPYENFNFLF